MFGLTKEALSNDIALLSFGISVIVLNFTIACSFLYISAEPEDIYFTAFPPTQTAQKKHVRYRSRRILETQSTRDAQPMSL